MEGMERLSHDDGLTAVVVVVVEDVVEEDADVDVDETVLDW